MKTRRIITGYDENGASVVKSDCAAENMKYPNDNIISTLLWSTDKPLAEYLDEFDGGSRILGSAPPPTGSKFIMFEVLPGGIGKLHQTDTLDYVIGIEGEMTMLLDAGETVIRQGDVLIQRGTAHGWENRTDKTARVAIVMIDGTPKREGSISGGETAR